MMRPVTMPILRNTSMYEEEKKRKRERDADDFFFFLFFLFAFSYFRRPATFVMKKHEFNPDEVFHQRGTPAEAAMDLTERPPLGGAPGGFGGA